MPKVDSDIKTACYHCGLDCPADAPVLEEKRFCCTGCKAVYQLLHENNLTTYYKSDSAPGIRPQTDTHTNRFAYLDDAAIQRKLLEFSDNNIGRITLQIPQIHCASCIWLLENLFRLHSGVIHSEVNFLRKELSVVFNQENLTLRQLVELLASLGYEPTIHLESLEKKTVDETSRRLYLQIAVAGFAFANIMLFSFPEYFALESLIGSDFARFFGYFNLLLAIPVLLYSSRDYFSSAITGLRHGMVNIDVPIALGMIVLFSRSVYEILSGIGMGYMDSFSGLVFFLLLGKLFQKKTYSSLSFDRNYKSYFPISVIRRQNDTEEPIPITNLQVGDHIVIRNRELVPADAVIKNGTGFIDYSFVTGESTPQQKEAGDLVYAGGRQVGAAVEMEVVKEVSQSYLTRLWNQHVFTTDKQPRITNLANTVSKYFTAAVLTIAFAAAVYWLPKSTATAVNAITAVLIIACPCALALSSPFTLGTAQRLLGKYRFFLKNSPTVEQLAGIDTIVFDKTGTLTRPDVTTVYYEGTPLTDYEKQLVISLVSQSVHPLSRIIEKEYGNQSDKKLPVSSFQEKIGQGISGIIDNHHVRIGQADWVGLSEKTKEENATSTASVVYVAIDTNVRGYYHIDNSYRPDLEIVLQQLAKHHKLVLLSGDNDNSRAFFTKLFGPKAELHFEQSPFDKLSYVKDLQSKGHRVMMIGDGLNDAGALKQADVGVSIAEDTGAFSPACDGILDAKSFTFLPRFMRLAKLSVAVIIVSFGISFLYNIVGISFAVSGNLSPVISAILMPLSSISVVLFATLATTVSARNAGLP